MRKADGTILEPSLLLIFSVAAAKALTIVGLLIVLGASVAFVLSGSGEQFIIMGVALAAVAFAYMILGFRLVLKQAALQRETRRQL